MKLLIVSILMFLNFQAFGLSLMPHSVCPPGQTRYMAPNGTFYCAPHFVNNPGIQNCIHCTPPYFNPYSQMQNQMPYPFPGWNTPSPQPWWVTQGQMYYPNFNFPGAWNNNGINGQVYPGQGQYHALKPNIYVKSNIPKTNFEMKFSSEIKGHFIASTPFLDQDLRTWKGEIEGDRFVMDNVNYDYLFYDIRFDHKELQFDHGACMDKKSLISNMKDELVKLKYSSLAIQDFEEHWITKIPSFSYYCVYPQYNKQLDKALPVTVSGVKAYWTRVLFIVTVHQNELEIAYSDKSIPKKPTRDPASQRPPLNVKREVSFQEWGVAFLDESYIKP